MAGTGGGVQRKGVEGGVWGEGCRASEADENITYRLLINRVCFVYHLPIEGKNRWHLSASRNSDVDVCVVGCSCSMLTSNARR